MKARLSALAPHKEAARRAAALLSLPMHAATGAKLVCATVDAMWRAAGDTATDFNFYTKRGILAGVYGATAMRWRIFIAFRSWAVSAASICASAQWE